MKKTLSTIGLFAAPGMAFALTASSGISGASGCSAYDLKGLICMVIEYMGYAIPFIFTLATIVFLWSVYNYFIKKDNDPKGGGLYVLYAVIGFFVMLSFWGLVNIVKNTIQVQDTPSVRIPYVNSGSGTIGH